MPCVPQTLFIIPLFVLGFTYGFPLAWSMDHLVVPTFAFCTQQNPIVIPP